MEGGGEISPFKNWLVQHEAVPQRSELFCICPLSYLTLCCLAHLVCSWLTLFSSADLVYLLIYTAKECEGTCIHSRKRETFTYFWLPAELFCLGFWTTSEAEISQGIVYHQKREPILITYLHRSKDRTVQWMIYELEILPSPLFFIYFFFLN